jgi:hypothetical protein
MENQSHYVGVQTYRDEKKEFWNCWDIAINGQQLVQPTLRREGCHCQW